jgi:hypothetical protein
MARGFGGFLACLQLAFCTALCASCINSASQPRVVVVEKTKTVTTTSSTAATDGIDADVTEILATNGVSLPLLPLQLQRE